MRQSAHSRPVVAIGSALGGSDSPTMPYPLLPWERSTAPLNSRLAGFGTTIFAEMSALAGRHRGR